MTIQETNPTNLTASYIVNQSSVQVKIVISKVKEEKTNAVSKPVAAFAKNTRYSINNNGGGYTGL